MRKIPMTKVKNRMFVDEDKERYSMQDVLVTQHNYPQFCYETDYVNSVYNDRATERWSNAINMAGLDNFMDDWSRHPKEKILQFVRYLFNDMEITGFRLVRYTNVGNGYPLWRMDVFKKSPSSPNDHVFKPLYKELPIRGVNLGDRIKYTY